MPLLPPSYQQLHLPNIFVLLPTLSSGPPRQHCKFTCCRFGYNLHRVAIVLSLSPLTLPTTTTLLLLAERRRPAPLQRLLIASSCRGQASACRRQPLPRGLLKVPHLRHQTHQDDRILRTFWQSCLRGRDQGKREVNHDYHSIARARSLSRMLGTTTTSHVRSVTSTTLLTSWCFCDIRSE